MDLRFDEIIIYHDYAGVQAWVTRSKPLLNVVRFEPLKQWNRKRQHTAKSCVRPTT